MTAKEYLNEPRRLYHRARRLEERYTELFEKATSPKCALNLGDGLGVQSSPSGNSREKLLVDLADAKLEYVSAELDYIECRQNVFELIYDIDGNVGDVLYKRYIKMQTWEQITNEEGSCSLRNVHKLHNKGLRIVEDKLQRLRDDSERV